MTVTYVATMEIGQIKVRLERLSTEYRAMVEIAAYHHRQIGLYPALDEAVFTILTLVHKHGPECLKDEKFWNSGGMENTRPE